MKHIKDDPRYNGFPASEFEALSRYLQPEFRDIPAGGERGGSVLRWLAIIACLGIVASALLGSPPPTESGERPAYVTD